MRNRRWMLFVTVFVGVVVASGCRQGAVGADTAQGGGRFGWEGNTLGVTDQVPQPWKPLKLKGSAVEYWGGKIDFEGSCLPAQITSHGVELLSRPVGLKVRLGSGPVTLSSSGAPQPGAVTEASVKLATSAETPQLTVRCDHTVEFDGMIRTDMTVTARQAARIESLTLEVPLRAEAAGYYRRFYVYDFEAMKADKGDLIQAAGSTRQGWAIPFSPYVWIGQPAAGLEWFCETDQAWRPWGRPDALALKPGDKEVVLEAHMIGQPQSLRAGDTWQVTFGLSPTPSRPRVANWRSYRWGGRMDGPRIEVDTATHNVFAIFWINEPQGLALEYPGMPWPENPTAFRPAKAELERERIRYVPYGSLFKMDTTVPEWAAYGSSWSGGRQMVGWKSRRGESQGSSVDISAPTFQDFLVYTYAEMVRQYNIDGLYFDFGAPGLNPINPNQPEGRLAEQGIYYAPLFALRNLYKRLYVATEGQKPGFLTIVHGRLPAMCGSFINANVGGEGFQDLFNHSGLPAGQAQRTMAGQAWYVPDYVATLPVDWFVAEFGRNVSEFPLLIPEITKQNKPYFNAHPDQVEAYTRGMIALAAVADIHAIWLVNADNDTLQRFSAAKATFSPLNDDCHFYPAWQDQVHLQPATPGVYATMYTLPDRALVIVSNLGRSAAKVAVDPGLAGLGVKPAQGKATDAMTGAALPLGQDGKVSVAVPAKDFAVVLIN